MGADGKELDVYYNPDGKSDKIFRVIQLDTLTGKFDEYKIMIGFDTLEDAKRHYGKQGYAVLFENGNEVSFGKYGTHTDFPDLDGDVPSDVFTVGEHLYPY